MDLDLKGKRAFVAGSSGGIGKAIASGLAAEGCQVMLCSRTEETLAALAKDLREAHGAAVEYVPANLDVLEDIERAIAVTQERFGGCDILVTNNGGPNPGDFLSMTEEKWLAGYHRTLMSTVRLIR